MEGPQKAPAAYFHSSIREARNTAAQGLREGTAGAHLQVTTTKIGFGDSVQHAFFLMEVIQMVTAVISPSCTKVKCTQHAPVKMHRRPGVPPRITMMLTNNGAIVEVGKKTQCSSYVGLTGLLRAASSFHAKY